MSTHSNLLTDESEPVPPGMLDYNTLRQEGIALLQKLAGRSWTDHNAHDPGITILEQCCYALSDLGYRAQFTIPDLLSNGAEDPYAGIYRPDQILPMRPVSLLDLRKQLIDLPGIKNAWIDLVHEPLATYDEPVQVMSYIAPQGGNTNAALSQLNVSEVYPKGLMSIRLEKSEQTNLDDLTLRRNAAQRLHACRNLGQDFDEITVLQKQDIKLTAELVIDAEAEVKSLLTEVYRRIQEYLSPPIRFYSLEEMQQRGKQMDEIFDGPLLEHGFIDSEELDNTERRSALRISDLIAELMTIPGLVAVKKLRFITNIANNKDWILLVDADKIPRFDLVNSVITLQQRSVLTEIDYILLGEVLNTYWTEPQQTTQQPQDTALEISQALPPGRDRQLARYNSLQSTFPACYGIAEGTLPATATAERKAQARQLQAYLMFYDQLLANQFAQLAQANTLFSFDDESSDSYFSQLIEEESGELGLSNLLFKTSAAHQAQLQAITEAPWSETAEAIQASATQRRNRFLDHLLARFAEQFNDYAFVSAQSPLSHATLAAYKRALLRDYLRIGQERGSGFNYLEPLDTTLDNISGLERRLRHKLGITETDDPFYLLEHILLRPMSQDQYQQAPLFNQAMSADPYSLQISLVFPVESAAYAKQDFIEQTVREETPAHLQVHFLWKNDVDMAAFKTAYETWLTQWRNNRRTWWGISS